MQAANYEIRSECHKYNIKLWELAEWIGVSESTMTRKLRRELPSEQRDHILSMICKLTEHKAEQEAEYRVREEARRNANNEDD